MITDSVTMLRRNLKHMVRYPSATGLIIGMPLIFMLLFVYAFGGMMGAGLGGDRTAYLGYVVPGIILLAVGSAAQMAAISVAMDMTEGIIDRFRTMAISRASVLTGHVVGSVLQIMLSVAVVVGVAVLMGYRPAAGPLDWLALAALLTLVAFALTWLSVALGLVSDSVETASNLPMFLMLMPFLGSGFVPTDSMAGGLRWFAEYQPFTPVTEALRALLGGAPVGNHAAVAVAWSVGIAVLGYLWARRLYTRKSA